MQPSRGFEESVLSLPLIGDAAGFHGVYAPAGIQIKKLSLSAQDVGEDERGQDGVVGFD
jgi:hypothetical protein